MACSYNLVCALIVFSIIQSATRLLQLVWMWLRAKGLRLVLLIFLIILIHLICDSIFYALICYIPMPLLIKHIVHASCCHVRCIWTERNEDLILTLSAFLIEPPHDKTNKMTVRPVKTQISLDIRPVWSESWLSAYRKLGSLATHWEHSEDSDQTGRMPRLIWVFAGRKATLLVLS